VVELLDERLEQLYLPEDEPAVFVKIPNMEPPD
jgi:hypothetical protein